MMSVQSILIPHILKVRTGISTSNATLSMRPAPRHVVALAAQEQDHPGNRIETAKWGLKGIEWDQQAIETRSQV